MDFVVIIEKADDRSYWAYVPDLPGCVSCGDTQDEVRVLIQEAINVHLESLRLHGETIPSPTSTAVIVHAA